MGSTSNGRAPSRAPVILATTSLAAAGLAWGSIMLLVAAGGVAAVAAVLLFAGASVVSGLAGIAIGIYRQHWLASAASAVALILVGGLVWWLVWSLKNF